MKLNLQATTKEEQKVKAYLEANASEVFAEKINNGVRVQKDGKTLINKKTLAGFLKFACDEAKKQAEKGASSACIDDDTVYGWAVHYFEEDSIEGTLYNEDGTEYQAPMPKTKPVQTKPTPPMPKPKPQLSIFDMVSANKLADEENEEPDDEPTDEDDTKAAEQLTEEEKAKPPERTVSPMYRKYLDVQEKYPQAIVATWATSMKCSARMQRCLQANFLLPLQAGIVDLKAVCRWSVFRIILRRCISAKS